MTLATQFYTGYDAQCLRKISVCRSRKLGKFRAYVSDPDCAVVLRWPDRCLVVSPAQPSEFTDAVRARLAGRY